MPYFPQVVVNIDLSGEDGGQFVVLARVLSAMRKNKIPEANVNAFRNDIAACQDYSALLATVACWVNFNHGEYDTPACRKWIR